MSFKHPLSFLHSRLLLDAQLGLCPAVRPEAWVKLPALRAAQGRAGGTERVAASPQPAAATACHWHAARNGHGIQGHGHAALTYLHHPHQFSKGSEDAVYPKRVSAGVGMLCCITGWLSGQCHSAPGEQTW